MNTHHIQVLTCGGTIDKIYFDAKSDYQVGDPQIATVLRESNVTFEYQVDSVFRKDSLEVTDEDRAALRAAVEACDASHILITHGTDTMVHSAKALAGIPGKTIVFTGSMAPARFQQTDAVFNIGCAVAAVQALPEGVYITMNGRIFDPETTRKNVQAGVFETI